MKRLRAGLLAALATAALSGSLSLLLRPSPAAAADEGEIAARKQCATRVSIAFTGLASDATLLEAAEPQCAAAELVQRPEFIERYASFLNSEFNAFPGETSAGDAPYHLAKYILSNGRPYHELFDGKFDVVTNATTGMEVVMPSEDGLGYFRSRGWLVRYAGNEPSGLRLTAGYRMLQNVTGLKLVAQNNVANGAVDVEARKSGPCAGCHYKGWTALDPIASILTRRRGTGVNMDFVKKNAESITIAGKTVRDDASLVALLVASDEFAFHACRLGFKYLRGRNESTCDTTMFDACVAALRADGTIQAGLVAIATQPEFCK